MNLLHLRARTAALPAACLCLVGAAAAQFPPQIPFVRTLDLLVVDSGFDGVYRLVDRNLDGDYNDAGEAAVFYSDSIGSVALTNPDCIAIDPLGVAYVGDSTVDVILSLRDANGDGDAHDVGEHQVFFDGVNNGSGVAMASVQGLTVDLLGNIFVAVANTSSVGDDMILRLRDLNADGDANDPGEATSYFTRATAAVGDSIPTQVRIAPNGKVYFTEVGATGVFQKGVWELTDLNLDGDANDPGEVAFFWGPPAPGNAFYWGLCIDRQGVFYVSDHGNETIWRAQDANGDGQIQTSEETLFFQSTASTWWDLMLRDDGVLLACEDQSPDRVTSFRDLNNDGDAMDPGESGEAYSELTSAVAVKPRAAAFLRGPTLEFAASSVPVNQAGTLTATTSKPGELVFVVFSPLLAQTRVPPVGVLGLDPAILIDFATGFSSAGSQLTLPFGVPNDPSLVGNWHFQGLAGDLFRLTLTNVATLAITP